MNEWERKLQAEGLGPNQGRDRRLGYGLDSELDTTYGLVSSIYTLAPSGDYLPEEERLLRTRNALKRLIQKHGHATVTRTLKAAVVAKKARPVRAYLLLCLANLPDAT